VDHDDDPYNINRGFFFAHMGWLFVKVPSEKDRHNVGDLQKDPLVVWQHNYCHWIGAGVGFVLPTLLGFLHSGWVGALGGLLIPGVARLVFVQHMTFFINSLCHCVGSRPYSSDCTARDSMIMAFFTFGEGYHNYHHHFQHDYRNGVKPWQFDPTKWTIWLLSKIGLTSDLRRVPAEKILLAEIEEMKRKTLRMTEKAESAVVKGFSQEVLLQDALSIVKQAYQDLSTYSTQLRSTVEERVALSRNKIKVLRAEVNALSIRLDSNLKVVQRLLPTLQNSAAS
jgi:stearoyl-CoA desaturase (delta-9 desaturase)